MNLVGVIIILSCLTFSLTDDNSTLKLVNVIFRHGNRNPDKESLWKSNPFYNESFYKGGYGQLTNEGKRTEYELGCELRKRYDTFLGDEYDIKYMDVRTTNYNRTKMSALLALAGLWPPKGDDIWSPSFNWQPIPYNFPEENDKLLGAYSDCTKVQEEINNVLDQPAMEAYIQGRYNETFTITEQNTGTTVDMVQAYYIYFGILIQDELGFPLEDWTSAVYPEPLNSAVIDLYYIMTNTTGLRRAISGYLLQKILADSEDKINGISNDPERKIYIYSAHEINIASMLLSLDAFDIVEVPPYGSYILFELHDIDGVNGFKMFYQNYKESDPIPVKLRSCDYFCPFDSFYEQVQKWLPTSDRDCHTNMSVILNHILTILM